MSKKISSKKNQVISAPAVVSTGIDKVSAKRIGAVEFFRVTKAELGRITWPTRKETTATTIMVFILVAILSIFFFLVDQILSYGIKVLLG